MNNLDLNLAPDINSAIFQLLYSIEVGVRELIIDALTSVGSPTWYKQCLPSEILQKYKDAKQYERRNPWTQFVPHHPLYYVDFPDLATILERKDNWEKGFRPIFGNKKDMVVNSLRQLEPIRNKVAHNRKATQIDLNITTATYSMLSSAIGPEHLKALILRCTSAEDMPTKLSLLNEEAKKGYVVCSRNQPLEALPVWISMKGSWPFDSDYLDYDISPVYSYFEVLMNYIELPRPRGSGHLISRWLKSQDFEEKYNQAGIVLSALLESSQK